MVTALLFSLALRSSDFVPNYANSMLTPYEGSAVAPRLFPARRSNPVRVAVEPDPTLVTDERLQLVIQACERWASATQSQPIAFRFEYVEAHGRVRPDVVIRFSGLAADGSGRGKTTELRGQAWTRLAVVDASGKNLAEATILRVATHEMGHALGIWGHSPNAEDMMSLSETAEKITIADVNTLELAYLRQEPHAAR